MMTFKQFVEVKTQAEDQERVDELFTGLRRAYTGWRGGRKSGQEFDQRAQNKRQAAVQSGKQQAVQSFDRNQAKANLTKVATAAAQSIQATMKNLTQVYQQIKAYDKVYGGQSSAYATLEKWLQSLGSMSTSLNKLAGGQMKAGQGAAPTTGAPSAVPAAA